MMMRTSMTAWMVASALTGATAPGETFHGRDGVVFEGTIRQVVSEAAVCNVLEEKYTADEYARLRANEGRSLHLWQVDFSVRNESGRELGYLRASSWVRSESPPCTNWSGRGPGGGPVVPEPRLLVPVVWSDYYEVLQKPYGMGRDQAERSALYVLAFDGHRPQFGEWDIDYRFAAAAGVERGEGPPVQQSRPAAAAGQLPPEIMADRYLLKAEQAVGDQDLEIARLALERLQALQTERGLELAQEDHFRLAKAWEAAGEPERALQAAVRYLQLGGRDAEHYTEALELMNRAELGKAAPPAGSAPVARAASTGPTAEGRGSPQHEFVPICSGSSDDNCWRELASHPGCYVWEDFKPSSGGSLSGTVTWSGGCSGGAAGGTGTLRWAHPLGDAEATGLLRAGKASGQWVVGDPILGVQEGPFLQGRKHGRWVTREDGTARLEETYADGELHGHYVAYHSDGTVAAEGRYESGKMHGRWVRSFGNGTVFEGPYLDNYQHGRWVERFESGLYQEGSYLRGKAHGHWVIRDPDGTVQEGPYLDDKRQGGWVERREDGSVAAEGPYVEGKRHGDWIVRSPDGSTSTVTFVHGERQ